MLEVHRQEPDVIQHIAPAEPVVELEPVEDARTVVEAEDVLGEQVAVPVDDAAPSDALVQQRRSARPGSGGRAPRPGRAIAGSSGSGTNGVDLAQVPRPTGRAAPPASPPTRSPRW